MPTTTFLPALTNPLGLGNVGSYASPVFVDIDGDGDLDALVSDYLGNTRYFQNTGSASSASFAAAVVNPFGLTNAGYFANPAFVDIDGDGDLDVFIGEYYGDTVYFQNTGTATSPAFAASVKNPFGLTSLGYMTSPAFADIDGDGDFDALITDYDGNNFFYQNTGTASAPAFAAPTTNPFGIVNGGIKSKPEFVDFDGDGDFDLVTGQYSGAVKLLENTGSATSPAFTTPGTDPFGITVATGAPSVALADLDTDGDLDLLAGNFHGNLLYYQQVQFQVRIVQTGGNTKVTEGGTTDSYTLVLRAPPTADVTVTLSATNGQASTNVSSLVFTTANWNVPQSVTVSATNDTTGEFAHRGVIRHTVTSADPAFNNLATASVAVAITDNDLYVGNHLYSLNSTNPAGLSSAGSNASLAVADLDADGDLDVLIGGGTGSTLYFQNTGTATAMAFAAPVTNAFGLATAGLNASPAFADSDGDGDLDVFIGNSVGNILYFQNTGTAASAAFAAAITNPFGLSDVGDAASPVLVDINGDGDLDMFIGNALGNTLYFQNTGTVSAPAFAAAVTNPFGLTDIGSNAKPSFVDHDGDGDLDVFIGTSTGTISYFQNTGTASSPAFAAAVTSAFNLGDVGNNASPAMADLNADGVLDALIANSAGNTLFHTSQALVSITGDAGNNTIQATAVDNILDGLGGTDTLRYDLMTAGVTVNLSLTTIQATGGSGSDQITGFENLAGTAFADTLTGNTGANLLEGLAGNDVLNGGAGNDTLDGGIGADTLVGGANDDLYVVDDAADVVTEAAAAGTDTVHSFASNFVLPADVESGHIKATGASNLTGNSLNNNLFAGTGDNVINGGDGIDTLSYASMTAGVTLSLSVATPQATGGSGLDQVSNIEAVIGTAFDDMLTGDAAANSLSGQNGNDTLDGAGGADTLTGGLGDDLYIVDNSSDSVVEAASAGTDSVHVYAASFVLPANVEVGHIKASGASNLTGNSLNNTLFAGSGDNNIDGSTGTDILSYIEMAAGVTVNLSVATPQATGGSGLDQVLGIERLTGTNFADNLTGDGLANVLSGMDGNDTLSGGIGNDTLEGGAGSDQLFGGDSNDSLDGGTGADTMDGGLGNDIFLVDDAGDVVVEAAAAGTDTIYLFLTGAVYTMPANVENAEIKSSGAASLTGNTLGNIVYAGTGDNQIDGLGGTDTLRYDAMPAGVTVSLLLTTAQATGGSGLDTLMNFENLVGTAFADSLTGNATANTLTGLAGNDQLFGDAGNDILDGGIGADTMHGGLGNDVFYVDDAGDVVTEASGEGSDSVYLNITTGTYIMPANVEEARILTTGAVNVDGAGGNDTIFAGRGNNIIDGKAGTNTLRYDLTTSASAAITVDLSIATAQATGGSGTDTIVNFANLVGSGFSDVLKGTSGNNTISGNNGNDTITGGDGNDALNGDAGNDVLDGGIGNDTLTGGTNQDILAFSAPLGAANADTIIGFSLVDDTIRLDAGSIAVVAPGLVNGVLPVGFFAANATGVSMDADDYFTYNTNNGQLRYDADGNGGLHSPVLIATIGTSSPRPLLTNADILINL